MQLKRLLITLSSLLMVGVANPAAEQPVTPVAPADPITMPRFPSRPSGDPVRIANGKALYSVNCSFCHGANAKGGESGPNLVRSEVVLNDHDGEGIGAVVSAGRLDKGMPKFEFTDAQVADIAQFLHSFPVGDALRAGRPAVSSLVGDAASGAAYFIGAGRCSTCHSISGDLRGVGARYDSKELQQYMLQGGKYGPLGLAAYTASPILVPPGTSVKLTLAGGTLVEGSLDSIDEFIVRLKDPVSGELRTYQRNGSIPKVEIHDPLTVHREMLRTLQDTDIQNLTSYLATLK